MTGELPDWLSHRARVLPDHPAVISAAETVTYRQLDARVARIAGALRAAGVEPGDRVAVLSPNCLEVVELIHAVPRAGGVYVPLNARLTAAEVAWQLEDSAPRLFAAHPTLWDLATAAAREAGITPPTLLPLQPAAPLDGGSPVPFERVHSIIYTSGTTGRAKGALLTFGNFWASAIGSAFNLGVDPADRWLACLPLFHVGGLSIVLRSAIYGTTVVLHPGFDEAAVARSLRDDRVTLVSVVATMLQRLLDADPRPAPPWLRVVLAGGGPVPLPLLQRALERGYPVVQTYGLTEAASQVATLAPADAVSHAGSAGKPLLTTQLRVDLSSPAPAGEGQAVRAGEPGEPGEILVAGPTISPGYWRQEGSNRDESGWFRTGDVGRLDPDGYLYVLDRRDDLLVTGGENVYPAEVEAALLGHPQILAVAVVGLPDATWGQAVAAAVVGRPGISFAEVEEWLRARLAGYKVPRRFVAVEELPLTASGKVRRIEVRERLLRSDGP